MSDKAPIISIITPTYNRADELKHLYRSIRQQSIDLEKLEFQFWKDIEYFNSTSISLFFYRITSTYFRIIFMKNHENQKRQNLKFNPQVLHSTTILTSWWITHDRLWELSHVTHVISEISNARNDVFKQWNGITLEKIVTISVPLS